MESHFAPLIRFIYYDPVDIVFYIENEEGMLYCSLDKKRWFLQIQKPKGRPYHGKLNRLRKLTVSDEVE